MPVTAIADLTINSLALDTTLSAHGPALDFSILPWRDAAGVLQNAHNAFLAEDVAAEPVLLEPGVHLHWTLPDALTRSQAEPGLGNRELVLPPIPNRWLVQRTRIAASGGPALPEALWLVESDYMGTSTCAHTAGSLSFPVFDASSRTATSQWHGDSGRAPYFRLGRTIPLRLPNTEGLTGGAAPLALANARSRHLIPGMFMATAASLTEQDEPRPGHQPLTAFGWGDPGFLAMYSKCRNVLGLCDPCTATDLGEDKFEYLVVGWSGDPAQDMLAVGSILRNRFGSGNEIFDALGWIEREPCADPTLVPAHIVFCGKTSVTSDHFTAGALPSETAPAAISIGQDGMSTISRLLLATTGKNDAGIGDDVEDVGPELSDTFVAAIQLHDQLSTHDADVAQRLSALRHKQSFVPRRGGLEWQITPNNADSAAACESGDLAKALSVLNQAQVQVERRLAEKDEQARLLQAEVAEYLRARARLPDKTFVDVEHSSERLWAVISELSLPALNIQQDRIDAAAAAVDHARAAIDAMLADRRLGDPGFDASVVQVPAPRFWSPADPVLAMLGKKLPHNRLHGQAIGYLRCDLPVDFAAITPDELVRAVAPHAMDRSSADQAHPVELAWSAMIQLEGLEPATQFGIRHLDPDFITDRYALPEQTMGNIDPRRQHRREVTLADREAIPQPHQLTSSLDVRVENRSMLIPASLHLHRRRCAEWIVRHADPASLLISAEVADQGDQDPLAARIALVETQAWALSASVAEGVSAAVFRPPAPPANATAALRSDFTAALATLARINTLIDAGTEPTTCVLSGFNAATLGLRQGLRLPPSDPSGPNERDSTLAAIAEALAHADSRIHDHHAAFNPLRMGSARLESLTIIDSFGRATTLDEGAIAPILERTESFADPSKPGSDRLFLPPRFAQPARIEIDWVVAEHGARAIRGWLVAVPRDRSLHVHDADGNLLGAVELSDGVLSWIRLPVATALPSPAQIDDSCLAGLVAWLLAAPDADSPGATFDVFLDSLVTAGLTIHPVDTAFQDIRAFLFGRPIAVMAARVGLGFEGLPMADTSVTSQLLHVELTNRIGTAMRSVVDPGAAALALVATRLDSPLGQHLAGPDLAGAIRILRDEVEAQIRLHDELVECGAALYRGWAAIEDWFGELCAKLGEMPGDIAWDPSSPSYRANGVIALIGLARAGYDHFRAFAELVFLALTRPDCGIRNLRVPVFLGDPARTQDGLYGFWQTENGVPVGAFRASILAPSAPDEHVEVHAITAADGSNRQIEVSAASPVDCLVLMDPTAQLHVHAGLLPTAVLPVPTSHASAAINDFGVVLACGPILTGSEGVSIPLPQFAGARWRFVGRTETGASGPPEAVHQPTRAGVPASGTQLREGWLKLEPAPAGEPS